MSKPKTLIKFETETTFDVTDSPSLSAVVLRLELEDSERRADFAARLSESDSAAEIANKLQSLATRIRRAFVS